MNKLEKVAAKAARKFTEKNVKGIACFGFFHQPKISESMKKRLEERK